MAYCIEKKWNIQYGGINLVQEFNFAGYDGLLLVLPLILNLILISMMML